MKKIDLKNYTESLLNTRELSNDFSKSIDIVQIALIYYRLGLENKPFEIEVLLKELNPQKEVPEQFHTLIAKLSAIKSGDAKADIRDYLFKESDKLLREYTEFCSEHNELNKYLPRKTEYPICPRCFNKSVAGTHMTSNDSRSIYCTSGSCNYDVPFETLTTPVDFKHINKIVAKLAKHLLK